MKRATALARCLAAALSLPVEPIRLARYLDNTEVVFFVDIPKGWRTAGGMVRVNPLAAQGGVGNAAEAKIDFAVAKDAEGRVMIRWLLKVNYAQPSLGNAMLGGNWNCMPVVAMPTAAAFLEGMLFPSLRPRASGARVLERRQRPDIAASLEKLPVAQAMRSQGAYYVADAARASVRSPGRR
jgi:hypothetical protein